MDQKTGSGQAREALGLRADDIDFASGCIHVRCQRDPRGRLVPPKYNSVRDVTLFPELAAVLRGELERRNIEIPEARTPQWVTIRQAARRRGVSDIVIKRWAGLDDRSQRKPPIILKSRPVTDADEIPVVRYPTRVLVDYNEVETYEQRLTAHQVGENDDPSNGLLLMNPYGRPANYGTLGDAFREARKTVGLTKRTPAGEYEVVLHTLRHTWGSHLISLGADIVTVSKQLGHKDIQTTLTTYTHEYDRQQQQTQLLRLMAKSGYAKALPAGGPRALPKPTG